MFKYSYLVQIMSSNHDYLTIKPNPRKSVLVAVSSRLVDLTYRLVD